MRMSMELMTRKHKQQNKHTTNFRPLVYSIRCKMQRFSTAFRERSVTDINNKRDAKML